MSEHARLSPSDERWPKCPGSVRESERYPDKPSPAAIDGTGSHILLELSLNELEPNAFDYVGKTIAEGHDDKPEGWLVDEKRAERVQVAIDYVARRQAEIGSNCKVLTECKTFPGLVYGRDDWWGTCDITLISSRETEVIDYKDGFNYVAAASSQLFSYAIGQVDAASHHVEGFELDSVRATIIQPKNETNQIRSVSYSPAQLNELGEKLATAALLTDDPNAPLIAGDHCKWCPHKPNCSARNEIAVKAINGPVNPVEMTIDQLVKVVDAMPMIESFLESVQQEVTTRIQNGEVVPGYDLVAGRTPNPKWIDEELALKKLQGMRFKQQQRSTSKIITPTQALKLELTDKQRRNLEKLIERPEAKKKLKKVSFKTAEEMFKPKEEPKQLKQKKPVMKEAAEYTYEEYIEAGWTNEDLEKYQLMEMK